MPNIRGICRDIPEHRIESTFCSDVKNGTQKTNTKREQAQSNRIKVLETIFFQQD